MIESESWNIWQNTFPLAVALWSDARPSLENQPRPALVDRDVEENAGWGLPLYSAWTCPGGVLKKEPFWPLCTSLLYNIKVLSSKVSKSWVTRVWLNTLSVVFYPYSNFQSCVCKLYRLYCIAISRSNGPMLSVNHRFIFIEVHKMMLPGGNSMIESVFKSTGTLNAPRLFRDGRRF